MTKPKSASPIDVVVAGYLGVDLAPGFPPGRPCVVASEVFRPGSLIETKGLSISLGGVVANTGLAMKIFGHRTEFMGCVGADALGDTVLSLLRSHGVKHGIRRSKRPGTAYGIVLAPPGVNRIFFEDPGCNADFTADDIDLEVVRRSRLFHFGYPPLMRRLWSAGGKELEKMLSRIHRLGVAISMDMALPDPDSDAGKADWRKILAAALPFVDIFAPSIEELLFMMDRRQYTRVLAESAGRDLVDAIPQATIVRLADELLAMGVKVLMIKAGHRGAYFRTGDVGKLNAATALNLPAGNWSQRSLAMPAFATGRRRVRNTCGAGDCAVAGFLSALLRGMEIEQAARCAMLAGRDNLYGTDACSGLSSWAKMTAGLGRRGAKKQRKKTR
jgi:sugar/nucleoside kinase (ribokinase family)